MIRVPIIRVKDKDNNSTHIVGTNIHDSLIINRSGLSYYNLQNSGSTMDFYEFEGTQSYEGYEVEFISIEEYINLMLEELKKQNNNEIALQKHLNKLLEEFFDEGEKISKLKSEDGYIPHT